MPRAALERIYELNGSLPVGRVNQVKNFAVMITDGGSEITLKYGVRFYPETVAVATDNVYLNLKPGQVTDGEMYRVLMIPMVNHKLEDTFELKAAQDYGHLATGAILRVAKFINSAPGKEIKRTWDSRLTENFPDLPQRLMATLAAFGATHEAFQHVLGLENDSDEFMNYLEGVAAVNYHLPARSTNPGPSIAPASLVRPNPVQDARVGPTVSSGNKRPRESDDDVENSSSNLDESNS